MSINDKLRLCPSQGCQNVIKTRLCASKKGLVFLKRKADNLQIHFRDVATKLILNKNSAENILREAFLSLAQLKFIAGDVSQSVLENVDKASTKIYSKTENVGGVKLLTFWPSMDGSDPYKYACLARGGEQVNY